jgi:hypothetical protein
MTLAVQKSVTSWAGRLIIKLTSHQNCTEPNCIGKSQYVGVVVKLRVDDVSSTPNVGEDVNNSKQTAPLHSPPLD